MDTYKERDVTEIEERIQVQRERAEHLQAEIACECPDKSCPVQHES